MENSKTIRIDLSKYTETFINTFYFRPDGKDKDIDDFKETNNKFGWDVKFAEIQLCIKTNKILEYRLFSEGNNEQAHAKKVSSNKLDYWRYEFIGRDLDTSPDNFEPSLSLFLKFYYQEYSKEGDLQSDDLELPVVFYELTSENQLRSIRYSLTVNNLYVKPLFYLSFTKEGFLQSISDRQTSESKNIVFPTPNHENTYLLQKFHSKKEGLPYHLEEVNSIETNTIVFRGFRDYKVKYYADIQLEPEFIQYGFFVNDLRKIITEVELLLKFIPTINYHLIKPCNMKCKHCFSDFEEIEIGKLEFKKASRIIDQISKVKSFKKLNFSGGEPTSFNKIEKLVAQAKMLGLQTSLVTNGFKAVKKKSYLQKLIKNLDLLVLSIDSFDSDKNILIGRHVNEKTISIEEFHDLAKICDESNVKLKVNTVVTKLNCQEILAYRVALLKPIRWKIFRMLPIKDQNEKADDIHPSNTEFSEFLSRNISVAEKSGIKVVAEDNTEMTGSYLMISPDGRFFNNLDGEHNYSDPILDVGILEALNQTPLLREVFYRREGDYSCSY
jgi:radical S-adenosyl methionine domain-containing protein 2